MTDQQQPIPHTFQVDPARVLQILEQTHPDAWQAAVQQARAEQAEARVRELELEAALATSGTD